MLKLNPNLSIITVKVNGLNISIKRQRLSDAFFFSSKKTQLYAETHFKYDVGRLK